jgi:diguanylate cyclase (GGDEF)-like protein/PAS domain S-box-containing protein
MTHLGRLFGWPLAALSILGLVLLLHAARQLAPLEHRAMDVRARLLQREVASDIVIVGIDARSLADLQQWPWPRRYHARLLERIAEAGPRRVFVDVDFSARANPEDDALLSAALASFRQSRVVLPVFHQLGEGADQELTYTRPLDAFARHADLAGVNFLADTDGLIRRTQPSWELDGREVPSAVAVVAATDLPAAAEVPIDYSISPASFEFVSFVDLLAGRIDPAVLSGKTIMIGATAIELGDVKAVPVYRALPGVVIQALAAQTLREGAPRPLPAWVHIVGLAVLAGLAAAYFGTNGWRRNALVLTGVLLVLGWLNLYAYAAHRLILEFIPALLVLGCLFLAATIRSLDQQTMRAFAYALGLRRRDALLGSVVETSADAIMVIDNEGLIEMANAAAATMFGSSRAAMVGMRISRLVPMLDGHRLAAVIAPLAGKVSEQEALKQDGGVFPIEISVSPSGAHGEMLWTVIVRDITERKAQEHKLQYEATHDSLTDLPNRAALMMHLERALTQARPGGRVALLMLDLCRFKEVNDTLGHEIGDQVLREVARRFGSVEGSGFVARLGGDEFTLMLEASAASDEEMVRIAGTLHDSLREPISAAGIAIDVGVSIGIARYPDDAGDAATLLRHADVAMYVAKRRQARFEVYDPASDRNSVRRLAMVSELRNAIDARQLQLHYQPQVNLRTGRCECVEALVRWSHPEYGPVSPAEFIILAESTDLIRPLTEWTITEALSQAATWQAAGMSIRVAVNLSARLLQDTDFAELLERMLAPYPNAAQLLELEITESAMMYDSERALRVIKDIHQLGVAMSIDDFGTGFSSLGYLRELPVHALKLDKSFVMNLHERANDRSIVNSTVRMAHELGLEVVAEGVETQWTAEYLTDAGYDYGQGWFYSKALPAEQCGEWILAFNAARERRLSDDARPRLVS